MLWWKVLRSLAPPSLLALAACAPTSPAPVEAPPPPVIAPVGSYAPPAPAEYVEPPAYHRHRAHHYRSRHYYYRHPVSLRRHVTRHHSGEVPASSPPNSPLPR
jgi:hypothetical protein